MALTDTTKTELYRFFAIAFDAAPGVTYMNQLAAAAETMTVEQIVEVFTAKTEFTSVYPTFFTNKQFATKLIENTVGSAASAEAKAEAVAQVEAAMASGYSRGKVIYQIFTNLAGLTGDAKWGDTAKLLSNQVAYAQYYTEELLKGAEASPNLAALRAVIADVTPSSDTTTAALSAALNPPIPVAGKSFTLSTGTETVTGGAGDDTINAPLAGSAGNTMTYSTTDVIDGGAGTDSMYLESNIAAPSLALVKSVEAVSVNASNVANTVTLPNDKMAVALTNSGSTVGLTFANVASGATTLALNGTGNFDTQLNYTATALTGAADVLKLSLTSANGGTVKIAGSANVTTNNLESIAITTVADSNVTLDLNNTALSKITVAGSGATTFNNINNAGADLKTIDASAATGAVTVPAVAGVTALSMTGGAGNDAITGGAGNDMFAGGAGDDTITSAGGNDNVDGGAGNDRVVLASADLTKDDTIAGGEGTDTLSFSGTLSHSTTSTDVQPGTRLSGFETIRSNATGAATIDMTGVNAGNTVTSVIADGNNLTLTKDAAVTSATFLSSNSISVASAGTQSVTIGQATGVAALSGTLTTGATTLNVGSANKLAIGDQNTFTIGTSSTSVVNATVATVNLSGANRITLTGNGATAVTKVDASQVTATANAGASAVTVNVAASKGAVTFIPGAGAVNVTTGEGADTVGGSEAADTFSTGDGNDSITAGGGNDTITNAGKGNDVILLGAGDDTVTDAGEGNDSIVGGDGNDTVTTAGAGDDTLDGGEGNDNLTAGDGNDSLIGGAGNDTLSDGAGNDNVSGGDGNDTITIATGVDTVDGGAGNDSITISGLGTGDSITGGDGTDTLTIVNSSTATLVPSFTSIESAVVRTSTAFNLNLTDATDKTSLKAYTISATDNAGHNVSLTNIASGSTVTLTDDNSRDGTSGVTDDTGNLGAVTIDTTAAGSLTVNINPNIDGANDVATGLAAVTITDANTVTINTSGGNSSNRIQHNFANLVLDNEDTVSVTIAAAANAGLTTGAWTNAAAVETVSITSGANAQSSIGTVQTATGMTTLTAKSSGTDSSVTVGAIGGTGTSQIGSLTAEAASGSTTTLGAVTATAGSAATAVSLQALGANSSMQFAAIDMGTRTLSSLTLKAETNSTIGAGAVSVTSGAVTASSVSFADYSTLSNAGAADELLNITGAQTALTMSIGRNVSFTDDLRFTGNVTKLTLTTNTAAETVVWDNANDLNVAGGSADVLFVNTTTGVAEVALTHSGTGTLNYDGTNVGKSNVTGNIANDTMVGSTGNDTFSGGAGDDSITGGAGNDSITVGEGTDFIDGGAGNDSITMTETTATAEIVRLTNGVAAKVTNTGANGDDTGADSITGFDVGTADTLIVTATGVTNYVHGTASTFGTAGTGAVTATGVAAEFGNTTLLLDFNYDGASIKIASDTVDMAITMGGLVKNGASVATDSTTREAEMEARLRYDLTGTAAADTITGGALADTITGGNGADSITGAGGLDLYNVAAGSSSLTIGGAGDAGTISGFDELVGYALGTGTSNAETIDMTGVTEAVLANGDTNGTDSTLTIGGQTVKSHRIAAGIATFDDDNAFGGAVALTTTAHLAAVVQYLQANDLGNAGTTVAFVVGTDTYVFMQGDDGGTDNLDILVKLTGVTGTSISATNANTAGLIDIGG